ncbi:MAG TPA: hypothetical protein VGL61_02395 [Kofleriaceae bacterium]
MRVAIALTSVLVGCGFRPHNAVSDAPGEGSSTADAPADAASIDGSAQPRDCMAEWRSGTIAFEPPQLIGELSTSGIERDPFVSQDELTIYFSHDSPEGDMDVYTASRAHVGDAFGSASPFDVVNTSSDESKMSISTDGLTLIVCRSVASGGDDDFMTTRGSAGDAWTTPQLDDLDTVNDDNYAPYDPELGSDGKTLYFAPVALDGDPQELALATRSDTSSEFGIATIPGYAANAGYGDADPWIDGSGDVLVFSRVPIGTGDVDIVYMTAGSNGQFGSVVAVPGVDTAGTADGDPWVSPDGCRMYFSSNRAGSYDLYVATAI